MSKTFRKNHKKGIIYQDKDRRNGILKSSRSCLNHGGCPYCEKNRLYKNYTNGIFAEMEIEETYGRKLHRSI